MSERRVLGERPALAPALFSALPAARGRLPWVGIGHFPTRVERIFGLVPRDVELWVKREDESGDLYGGNKVRKLEFLFGAARARGRTTLVTFGGWGAHHVAATSLYGPRHGFHVEAAVAPQPLDDHVRELLLVEHAAGARLIPIESYLDVLPIWARARLRADVEWLAGGGSSAIGALGWVSGGFELEAQVKSGLLPPFDLLYGGLGSGGTIAGLLASLRGPLEVVAVRVVDRLALSRLSVLLLTRSLERLLAPLGGNARAGEPPRLRVEDRFAGRYGEPTAASRAAVRDAAAVGLRLDPIYTGKVMAALLADARAGRLAGRRVLFLHSHNTVDLAPLSARSPGPTALPAGLRERLEA